MTQSSLVVTIGDITRFDGDAIVNAANSALRGGGGVDGAIHRAGGPAIGEECRAIVALRGGCPPGRAVITGGGDLAARYVIHAVGPIWTDDHPDEHCATLAEAYRSSLDIAAAHDVGRIAFPNISTGVYGFPKALAADVAIGAVTGWLADREGSHCPDEIVFVCHERDNAALYAERLAGGSPRF